uniref:Flocculation protein FLO11-like n=1 Tax=Saccoglossus kowalevskii TaxID=10224 RepID=A0ABM0MBN9_SACKO|nr:PREDICTED: flocculation protein FLO11-like [Saccoglossus kowalevskii]
MSLAVRVQTESQMTVQLFTIKNTTAGVKLLECDKCFTSVPKLIAHLCQHKECLPVPLLLPLPLLISKSIQELSALGLLGPDFWTSSMNRSATLPAIELLKVSPNKVYKSEAYVPLNDDDKQSVVQSTTIVQNVSVASPTLQPRSYTMPAVQLNNTTIPVSFTNPAYRTGSMSSPPAKSPPAKWVELSSQFDSDSNKRYPAPAGAPPPPPANQVPLYYQNPLHSSSSESSPRVERSSGDYYSPYEATKQNHLPPSSFGMYMNQLPPSMLGPSLLPPKRDGTAPVIPSPEDPYNVPSTGSQNPWVPSDQPSSSAFSASNRFMLSPGPSTTSNRLSALSGSSQLGGNSSVSSSNTSRNSFDSTGISTVLDNMSGSSNRTSFTSFGSDMSAVSASNDENRSDILDIRVPSCDASILKPVKSPVIQRPGETLKAFDPLNSASSLPVKKKQDWETFSDSNISVNSMNVAKCSAQDNLNWAFTGTDEKRSTVSSYTSSVFSTDSVFLPENEAGFSEFNVDDVNTPIPRGRSSAISRDSASLKPSVASSGTVFDDPWNSNLWEDLMNLGETKHQPSFTNSTDESSANEKSVQTNLTLERNSDTSATQTKRNTRGRTSKKNKTPFSPKNKDGGLMMSIFYLDDDHAALLEDDEKENEPDKSNRRKSLGLKEKFKPLLTPPSMVLKRRKQDPSRKIQAYIIKMSTNMNITFGHSVVNFIQCTKESTESNSATVMRNVRQFMNGIKHHLIQEDIGLQCVLNREKAKLGPDESLDNEDAIIEGALHKCVIKPLKAHIYQCLTREYSR